MALIDEGLGKWKTMGLDCNTGLWRSSLRLVVQDDAVFILSYNEHGPWNIIEGQRRVMTKGHEVNREYYLRRRAFIIKGNRERQGTRTKSYHMVYQ